MGGTMKEQLESAYKEFNAQNYEACEEILLKMPKDDLQTQHNLAVVRLLLNRADVEQTITALASTCCDGVLAAGKEEPKSAVTLLYEGHETAHFNRALLLARSGNFHESANILRGLLKMQNNMSPAILGRALSLLQTITRISTKGHYRHTSDDELIQKLIAEHMDTFAKDPALLTMVKGAFADSSTIHEVPHNSDAEWAVYFNNLGVLTMGDSKLNVASLCFAKAERAAAQSNTLLMRHPIVYNAGLCALLRGEYDSAITCFISVQDLMKKSPLFWVRFAEAALGKLQVRAREKSIEEYERMQEHFSEQLRSGKLFPNYEFLLLPGATLTQGPLAEPRDGHVSTSLESLACNAVQNALLLLLSRGHTAASAIEAFPHNAQLIHFALFYWCALEVFRSNYAVVVSVGSELLSLHDRNPLLPTLHAALLSYMVEALIHLNDPEQAIRVLRRSSLSSLLVVSSSEVLDNHQKARVEALFINLAITHIANGLWGKAASVVESLLAKVYENRAAKEKEKEKDKDGGIGANPNSGNTSNNASSLSSGQATLLACNILVIFLELAQGNKEKAQEALSRLSWTS